MNVLISLFFFHASPTYPAYHLIPLLVPLLVLLLVLLVFLPGMPFDTVK